MSQQLRDRRDPRAFPLANLVPLRILALAVDQHRAHPDSLRSCELVVRAVADEDRVPRLHPALLAGGAVAPRIRLPNAARAREACRVEDPRERRLLPQLLDVLAADGDQAEEIPAAAQLGQRL